VTRLLTTSHAGLAIVATVAMMTTSYASVDGEQVWDQAISSDPQIHARQVFEQAMLIGDDKVALAVAAERTSRKRLIEEAVAAYERAAVASPNEIEPHIRAAAVLNAFYIECAHDLAALCGHLLNRGAAERIIAHWDQVERIAPLDPRVTEEILFSRAILHTKLGGDEHWIAAAADYQKVLEAVAGGGRTNPIVGSNGVRANALGNLAETFMMLGDLDRAIETYRATLALEPDLSSAFGLAIALDRDEQVTESRRLMLAQGPTALVEFIERIQRGLTFFVPEGEAEYYLGVGTEFAGDDVGAIEHFEAFVRSGAHPRYQPRARVHIALLRARISRRIGRGQR
jgi:tetratricopeptide (TPR) repeat protein